MTLGRSWYQRQPRAFIGNTNLVTVYLYDQDEETLIPMGNITNTSFEIFKPGSTTPDYTGSGTLVSDGKATFNVDSGVHDVAGQYRGQAIFTYSMDGNDYVRTVPIEYVVEDPIGVQGTAPYDPAVDLAWVFFSDLFDSEEGGPWLSEMSMGYFSREKLRQFVPDVLLEINVAQPPSKYSVDSFPYSDESALAVFALGLELATIRHLKRSYVEQPNPANSPAAYHDRQQYLDRWTQIEATEKERFDRLLMMWKMGSFDIAQSAMLLGSKAGRLYPGNMRTRGRPGWWG